MNKNKKNGENKTQTKNTVKQKNEKQMMKTETEIDFYSNECPINN